MKILIVGKVTSGQTNRLKEEGRKRGHTVENCSSFDLVIQADKNKFHPSINEFDITSFNLIYLLTVGERKWEWYIACDFLSRHHGTKIVENKMVDPNYKVYFSSTAELLKQSEQQILFPKTSIILSKKHIYRALMQMSFPLIIKNSYQQRGLGVSKVDNKDQLIKTITSDVKSKSFMIREFIPNDGDIRVFTVGYKAIGAMKRIPTQKGEFRSNISRGGKGESFDLNKYSYIRDIAEKLSKINHTEIAGVDIMIHKETGEPYVLEINRGPQFAGLEKYTGVNAALKMVEYFEEVHGAS